MALVPARPSPVTPCAAAEPQSCSAWGTAPADIMLHGRWESPRSAREYLRRGDVAMLKHEQAMTPEVKAMIDRYAQIGEGVWALVPCRVEGGVGAGLPHQETSGLILAPEKSGKGLIWWVVAPVRLRGVRPGVLICPIGGFRPAFCGGD